MQVSSILGVCEVLIDFQKGIREVLGIEIATDKTVGMSIHVEDNIMTISLQKNDVSKKIIEYIKESDYNTYVHSFFETDGVRIDEGNYYGIVYHIKGL